jgi:hypothetical protein
MALGTFLLVHAGFATSGYAFGLGGHYLRMYIGLPALAANLAIALAGTTLMKIVTGYPWPAFRPS